MSLKFENIWIGLATVSALNDTGKGLLNGSKDGFVNVLGHSDNESDFKINVFIELNKLNLVLKSMEDVEPFIERIKNYEVDEELKKIAAAVNKKNIIGFGTFYTYEE